MKAITRIDTFKDLTDLASQCEPLSLGDGSPPKEKVFYLYRGVNNYKHQLLSSIQVHLKVTKKLSDWKKRIEEYERHLVNRFLSEIEPYRELNEQYHWFCPPCPKTDTFWYLALMQHFGCPTRLCDFTADFWTAVFFATRGVRENQDLGLYRLKCKNNDKLGNKLPKDSRGKPWSKDDKDESYNMNDFLGYIIGYTGFNARSREIEERLKRFCAKTKMTQMYGWDRPHFNNARIQKQRGFFVYNIDIKIPLEDSIVEHCDTEFQKYRISRNILSQIRSHLKTMGLIEWKVFLDLDKAFKKWKRCAVQVSVSSR